LIRQYSSTIRDPLLYIGCDEYSKLQNADLQKKVMSTMGNIGSYANVITVMTSLESSFLVKKASESQRIISFTSLTHLTPLQSNTFADEFSFETDGVSVDLHTNKTLQLLVLRCNGHPRSLFWLFDTIRINPNLIKLIAQDHPNNFNKIENRVYENMKPYISVQISSDYEDEFFNAIVFGLPVSRTHVIFPNSQETWEDLVSNVNYIHLNFFLHCFFIFICFSLFISHILLLSFFISLLCISSPRELCMPH
jgi:hypothetical protein